MGRHIYFKSKVFADHLKEWRAVHHFVEEDLPADCDCSHLVVCFHTMQGGAVIEQFDIAAEADWFKVTEKNFFAGFRGRHYFASSLNDDVEDFDIVSGETHVLICIEIAQIDEIECIIREYGFQAGGADVLFLYLIGRFFFHGCIS